MKRRNGESANAFDGSTKANEFIAVELIGPAEVVDDFGYRLSANGVPMILRNLGVLDDGAVLVGAFCGSKIHAYSNIVYPR